VKTSAALQAGVLGTVLAGLGSLLLGVASDIFTAGPLIYVAGMAGVLFPLVMVFAGALAWWASEAPGTGAGRLAPSLAAGLITVAGGGLICILTLAVPAKLFSGGDPILGTLNLGAGGYAAVLVLGAAYVALAVIGGVLYGLIFPAEGGNIG
jgi:hypothetical protein